MVTPDDSVDIFALHTDVVLRGVVKNLSDTFGSIHSPFTLLHQIYHPLRELPPVRAHAEVEEDVAVTVGDEEGVRWTYDVVVTFDWF